MKAHLHVGGLVALGFDRSGQYLLTVTHSGRGVFLTSTWERVARDHEVVYPESGECMGIGPLENQLIAVTEEDYDTGIVRVVSADGRVVLAYGDGVLSVEVHDIGQP